MISLSRNTYLSNRSITNFILLKANIILIILIILFYSCKNENEILSDEELGYTFYPLEIGMSKVYKVDSIKYQKSNNIYKDTSHSFLMEVVADSIRVNNELGYRIEIFHRKSESDNWEIIDNRFDFKTKNNVTIQENGLNYIKMIFPVTKNKSWDGNIQISQTNEIKLNGEFFQPFKYWNGKSYYYKDIQKFIKIGQINYDKVITVEEVDYTDDLNRIYSVKQYAEKVGLVYKEFWLLTNDGSFPEKAWEDKAYYGVILKQTLIQ